MPKTLADERIAVRLLPTAPANPNAITVAEYNAGIPLECRIMAGEYRLSPSGSDTINQAELCEGVNATTYGRSNYDASMTVFRYLTAAGLSDEANDVAWDATRDKGTTLHLVEREGPVHDAAAAATQEYSYFEVVTDDPQKPQDRTGFIRAVIPLGVQRASLNKALVAGGA